MVSLIIVDYRSIEKTIAYIRECRKAFANDADVHILVVDNCENWKESIQYLTDTGNAVCTRCESFDLQVPVYTCNMEDGKFLYIASGKNLGYAGGNNLGARASSYYYQDGYYLFSNNDLQFEGSFSLQDMIAPMRKDKSLAAVGPCIVTPNGEQQTPRKEQSVIIGLFAYYWDMLLPKKCKFESQITDVVKDAGSGKYAWVTGSFFLTDAEKFNEVGGFDEATFLFYEEVILASRFRQKNYAMYYLDSVKLIHAHGETVRSVFQVIKAIDISFTSSLYYFKVYRKVNRGILTLASIHYAVFRILFRLKKAIGRIGWVKQKEK